VEKGVDEKMSSYGANMAPAVTSGAYQGPMGMHPNASMQPNASFPPGPAYASPATMMPNAWPMAHTCAPMHCGPVKAPVIAAAAIGGSSTGVILVLFILLIIISRAIHHHHV